MPDYPTGKPPSGEGVVIQIDPELNHHCNFLHRRALIRSLLLAEGKAVVDLLTHPLLVVAQQHYPRTPLERQVVLTLLNDQLTAWGVRSEQQCPVDDLALVDWVEAALRTGEQLAKEAPERVTALLEETGQPKVQFIRTLVRDVLGRAGGTNLLRLTRAIVEWHKNVYGRDQPLFYGAALSRVVYVTDFALWIPWTREGGQAKTRARGGEAEN
jgi:hypothetical protein